MDERTHRISLRAYELWERHGRPQGRDLDDWLEAEREIEAELAHEKINRGPERRGAEHRQWK